MSGPGDDLTGPRQGSAGTWIFRSTALVVIAISLYFVYNWAGLVPDRLANWWVNSQVEAQPAWGTLRIAHGLPLFTDYLTVIPSVPITYGVLFYWVPATISRIFRHPTPEFILIAGRCISMIGFLGSLLIIYLLARQRNIEKKWAVVAVLPLWWMPWVTEWTTKFMPDFPALFLSLSGWWILGTKKRSRSSGKIMAAAGGLLFLISFHFKAIVVAGQVGCFMDAIYLRLRGDRSEAMVRGAALAVYCGLSAVTFYILERMTDGLYWLNVVSTAAQCSWEPSLLITRNYASSSWFLFLGMFLTAIASRKIALGWSLTLMAVLTLGLMSKQGANMNYMMCALTLWGLCISFWMKDLWARVYRGHVLLSFQCCIGIMIAGTLIKVAPRVRIQTTEGVPVSEASVEALRPYLLRPNQRILCFEPWLGILWNLPIPFVDAFHASLLDEKGLNPVDSVLTNVEHCKYTTIVTDFATSDSRVFVSEGIPIFPSRLKIALHRNYSPVFESWIFVVWEPKT